MLCGCSQEAWYQGGHGTNPHYAFYFRLTVGRLRSVSLSDVAWDSPGHASERAFADLTMDRLYIAGIAQRAVFIYLPAIHVPALERPPSAGADCLGTPVCIWCLTRHCAQRPDDVRQFLKIKCCR